MTHSSEPTSCLHSLSKITSGMGMGEMCEGRSKHTTVGESNVQRGDYG